MRLFVSSTFPADENVFVPGVSIYPVNRLCLAVNVISVATAQSALVAAFDTLVLALTFYKTYRLVGHARSAGLRSDLGEVVLRDGECQCRQLPPAQARRLNKETRSLIFQVSATILFRQYCRQYSVARLQLRRGTDDRKYMRPIGMCFQLDGH